MALPFGRILVAGVGVAVIAVGISQIVKGVKQNFTEDLDTGAGSAFAGSAPSAIAPRVSRWAIIGALFIWAAVSYDPEKAGGMDAALSTLRDQPFGTVLLVIMALGIACFGVYCFVWARKARY